MCAFNFFSVFIKHIYERFIDGTSLCMSILNFSIHSLMRNLSLALPAHIVVFRVSLDSW